MIQKIYMAAALTLGLLSLSPALSLAQTQNTFQTTVPVSGNMMYGTTGIVKGMPAYQTQNGQGQITLQSPMMASYGFKTFGPGYYNHFAGFGFLVCAITILMLWILMALAIVWLASHLKKNLHK